MPRNSSGTYQAPSGTTAVPNQVITSAAHNTAMTDVGQEITNSLDRLGRSAMQADLPMGNHKVTGLADGTNPADAATFGQIGNYPFNVLNAQLVKVSGAAGTNRAVELATAGSLRWLLYANATAESGANVGSDLGLQAYADDGVTGTLIFTVNRKTGILDFVAAPTIGGASMLPVGMVMDFPCASAPSGFLALNGQTVLRSQFPALWTFANGSGNIVSDATWVAGLGTYDGAFSSGDGSSTFRLPDARGNFRRGWDNARGVDSGRSIGTMQDHQLQDHTHLVGFTQSAQAVGTAEALHNFSGAAGTYQSGNPNSGNHGSETRPRNIAVLTCIKY